MKKQNEENAVGPPAQNSTYEGNSGQAQTNPSSQIQGIIRSTIEAPSKLKQVLSPVTGKRL